MGNSSSTIRNYSRAVDNLRCTVFGEGKWWIEALASNSSEYSVCVQSGHQRCPYFSCSFIDRTEGKELSCRYFSDRNRTENSLFPKEGVTVSLCRRGRPINCKSREQPMEPSTQTKRRGDEDNQSSRRKKFMAPSRKLHMNGASISSCYIG